MTVPSEKVTSIGPESCVPERPSLNEKLRRVSAATNPTSPIAKAKVTVMLSRLQRSFACGVTANLPDLSILHPAIHPRPRAPWLTQQPEICRRLGQTAQIA